MDLERKFWWQLALELGIAGAALGGVLVGGWALAEAIPELTYAMVRRIVDFFRGEEAIILEKIAELDRQLSEAGREMHQLTAERRELRRRLQEIRDAIREVEAEPVKSLTAPGAHMIYR